MATLDIEQTRNQARALLDSRIESVTALVKTRQRITDLKEQLAEAERDDKRAYVRATKDGWSPEELRSSDSKPAPPAAAGRPRAAPPPAIPGTHRERRGTGQPVASPLAHLCTAKAKSSGLFPHTRGRRDPADRLHTIARSPRAPKLTTGTGDPAQPPSWLGRQRQTFPLAGPLTPSRAGRPRGSSPFQTVDNAD